MTNDGFEMNEKVWPLFVSLLLFQSREGLAWRASRKKQRIFWPAFASDRSLNFLNRDFRHISLYE